jgi:hypothetical protein
MAPPTPFVQALPHPPSVDPPSTAGAGLGSTPPSCRGHVHCATCIWTMLQGPAVYVSKQGTGRGPVPREFGFENSRTRNPAKSNGLGASGEGPRPAKSLGNPGDRASATVTGFPVEIRFPGKARPSRPPGAVKIGLSSAEGAARARRRRLMAHEAVLRRRGPAPAHPIERDPYAPGRCVGWDAGSALVSAPSWKHQRRRHCGAPSVEGLLPES